MTTETSTFKGTPGEWRYEDDGFYGVQIVAGEGESKRLIANMVWPMETAGWTAEDEANSNVITAAPDMLEALKGAMLAFDEMAEAGRRNGTPGIKSWVENSATARQIRAAIAKALGGAS